jgi:hypothetical protein
MIGILAGDKRQANHLAHALNLHPDQWFFVWNNQIMRGKKRGQVVLTTGTYRHRDDIQEILNEIAYGGWQELYVDLDRLVIG